MFGSYHGAFRRGQTLVTENALEDIWQYVRRYIGSEYATDIYAGAGIDNMLSVQDAIHYALPRFRQACEFRDSARGLSLITKPLPLYYSLLNLTRAFYTMKTGMAAGRSHGLKSGDTEGLLESSASVNKTAGTFRELCTLLGWNDQIPSAFTLKDCLSQIPEICWQFNSPTRGTSLCVPIMADIFASNMQLTFNGDYVSAGEFQEHWNDAFPGLGPGKADIGNPTQPKLSLDIGLAGLNFVDQQDKIIAYCQKHLMDDVVVSHGRNFYLTRRHTGIPYLRREAAYFGAMFILGSIARYQPERLLSLEMEGSETAWFLGKFLAAAERFFPQFMISLFKDERLYYIYP